MCIFYYYSPPPLCNQNDGLLGLISGLLTIATATKEQPTDADEVDANRHTALYSLKLLSALLGEGRPVEFGPVLEASVTICHEERVNAQVRILFFCFCFYLDVIFLFSQQVDTVYS